MVDMFPLVKTWIRKKLAYEMVSRNEVNRIHEDIITTCSFQELLRKNCQSGMCENINIAFPVP
jgi:hypothetical protein